MAAAGEAAIWPQAASARTGSDWSRTWGIAHMAANPPRERLGWLDEPNYSPRTPCFNVLREGGNGVESLENRIASSSSVPVIITACVNLRCVRWFARWQAGRLAGHFPSQRVLLGAGAWQQRTRAGGLAGGGPGTVHARVGARMAEGGRAASASRCSTRTQQHPRPPPLLLSTQLVGRTPHMAHAKVVVEPQSGMARWMGIPGATRRSGLKLVRAHEGARSASAPCAHAHAHFAAVPRAAVPMPMLCPCRAHAMPVRCATALWLAMPPCRVAMLSMHATTTPPSAVRACIAPPHAPQL